MSEKYSANIGQRFGRLTIVSMLDQANTPRANKNGPNCLTKCDCGEFKTASLYSVRYGGTKSCGCLRKEHARRVAVKKIKNKPTIGKRYGEVCVVEDLGLSINSKGKRGRFVKLLCDCGAERVARKEQVLAGKIVICAKHHGLSRSKTSNIWRGMITRCTNPDDRNYAAYGGRGIGVSDDWSLFANFLRDMGPCPEGKSLDRIDNNQGYSKENCRWATTKEQARNKRGNIFLEYEGKRLCISDWAVIKKLKTNTIQRRIKAGWSTDRILQANESNTFGKLLFTEKDKRLNLWYRWRMMIKRCTDQNHESYHRYGGRGIKVCAQWAESFECFLHDVGFPETGESLDRIDNNGNYEPANVRWVDSKKQSQNKSTNAFLKIGKKTKTISEWSRITGVGHSLIRKRLNAGWSPEKAIGTVE